MNVNLALTRLRARAPKGQRAHGKRPQKRGQNVSVVGALSLTGLLTSVSIMGQGYFILKMRLSMSSPNLHRRSA